MRAGRFCVLLCVSDESFRWIDPNDFTCGPGRFQCCGKRPSSSAHIEYAVAIFDPGERDVSRRKLATPAAHEALVTSARGKHLCLRFSRVAVLGKYLVTEKRCKCQVC